MSTSRIEQYRAFLEKDPGNSFARYVIAQEYLKLDDVAGAVTAFNELITHDADYVAAYYHGGKANERLDDMAAARSLYENGIAVAERIGDSHARAELEEALATLPPA